MPRDQRSRLQPIVLIPAGILRFEFSLAGIIDRGYNRSCIDTCVGSTGFG
jgi:hypothetical protein